MTREGPGLWQTASRLSGMQSLPISCEEPLGGSLWWTDWNRTWIWSRRPFEAFGGSPPLEGWMPRVARFRWNEEACTEQHRYRLLNNYSRVAGLAVDGYSQRAAVLTIGEQTMAIRFSAHTARAKGEGRSGQPC